MAKILRKIMGGAVEFEDDDTPTHIQLFNKLGKAPVSWDFMTGLLHASALKLMAEGENEASSRDAVRMFRPIAIMLGAYAIETLFKMVAVDEYCWRNGLNYDAVNTKEFMTPIHDLVKLSSRAGLRTNKNDRALLAALWPAPGSKDTELGVLMELEVGHGETEVYPRVQA